MEFGLPTSTLFALALQPDAEQKREDVRQLFSLGSLTAAFLVGLVVGAAIVWLLRSRRVRLARVRAMKRGRSADPWAAAGERVEPLSTQELESQFATKPSPKRKGRGEQGDTGNGS